jgi:NhaP-type Na+/H+ or K+/H+ antiporter
MHESLLLGVATVFVLGLGAQWIAWRFRFPSILLLLVFGFVTGPVTGLLHPDHLQGNWVFTFVAVSAGIILFEGGLRPAPHA